MGGEERKWDIRDGRGVGGLEWLAFIRHRLAWRMVGDYTDAC